MSLYAPLIQINWKDSDLGIVSTSTSPSPSPSPTPTSPPTVIASASMPASSTTSAIIVSTESPSQSSSKGLATGAKVAVVSKNFLFRTVSHRLEGQYPAGPTEPM
ncbi:MAG: hypothetical protein M1820_001303 [Bogoriella megaspora]|nr:MAG: hypothetical protein M1820_001303 [Bogoriella megaspora]